ncbi:MAG: hypothetical protein SOZ81_11770, partial [Agathobacter sp.]|nr:hypothetical protein [Agathobacter sp.]
MTIANIADVVLGGIDSTVSGKKSVQKDTSASTNKKFTDFMSQTSGGNQNEKYKFVEKKTDISTDSYKYDGRKIIKEDTSNPIIEKIDSSKDTIEKFEKEIVETISEDLDVETEDVEKAMEVLGLSIFDLLNPQNLADITVEIKGLADSATLILNGDFQQLLGDISLVGKNLMQELNVTQNELADIVSMMDTAADMEFNTELNQEGMNIDSNIASDIDSTDNADSFLGLKDNISDDKMENDIAVAIETIEDSEQSLVNENQNNNLNDSKQNKEQFGDTLSGVFEESSSDKKESTKINAFERTIEQSIVTNSS